MALTDAQKRAKQNYLAKGKRLTIDFYPSEADIIEKLEQVKQSGGGVATYIKNLIRQDITSKTLKLPTISNETIESIINGLKETDVGAALYNEITEEQRELLRAKGWDIDNI